jgi:hypothetical protein
MESPAKKFIVIFFTIAALTAACFAPAFALQKDTGLYDTSNSNRPIAQAYLA